jgi:hypothetical protein
MIWFLLKISIFISLTRCNYGKERAYKALSLLNTYHVVDLLVASGWMEKFLTNLPGYFLDDDNTTTMEGSRWRNMFFYH